MCNDKYSIHPEIVRTFTVTTSLPETHRSSRNMTSIHLSQIHSDHKHWFFNSWAIFFLIFAACFPIMAKAQSRIKRKIQWPARLEDLFIPGLDMRNEVLMIHVTESCLFSLKRSWVTIVCKQMLYLWDGWMHFYSFSLKLQNILNNIFVNVPIYQTD